MKDKAKVPREPKDGKKAGLSRRDVLHTLGATATATLAVAGSAGAAAASADTLNRDATRAQEMAAQPKYQYSEPVIDAHVHWYPPEFVALIEKEGAANGVRDILRNDKGELECVVPGYHP